MQQRVPIVYILTNKPRGTLYIGVTSNPSKRIWQHKNNLADGFSKQHQLHTLVWYEVHSTMESAIAREKVLKFWKRLWKIKLIEESNSDWKDRYSELI